MDSDPLSYEEQQLQLILMKELKEQLLREERQVKELQDIEYQESLLKDTTMQIASQKEIPEISIEEMREIRIKRFS
jgi:hypothetical protein